MSVAGNTQLLIYHDDAASGEIVNIENIAKYAEDHGGFDKLMVFSGAFGCQRMLGVHEEITSDWLAIEAFEDSFTWFRFLCTPDHKLLSEKGQWIEARDIQVGTKLSCDGSLRADLCLWTVTKVTHSTDEMPIKVYDLLGVEGGYQTNALMSQCP